MKSACAFSSFVLGLRCTVSGLMFHGFSLYILDVLKLPV